MCHERHRDGATDPREEALGTRGAGGALDAESVTDIRPLRRRPAGSLAFPCGRRFSIERHRYRKSVRRYKGPIRRSANIARAVGTTHTLSHLGRMFWLW